MKNMEDSTRDIGNIITDLKETLAPEICRGFVDAFLIREQNLDVSN